MFLCDLRDSFVYGLIKIKGMSYFTTTKTIYDSVHEYPNKKKRGYGIIEGNPKVYD